MRKITPFDFFLCFIDLEPYAISRHKDADNVFLLILCERQFRRSIDNRIIYNIFVTTFILYLFTDVMTTESGIPFFIGYNMSFCSRLLLSVGLLPAVIAPFLKATL